MREIGERIGAVIRSYESIVYFLGYGEYGGVEILPGNIDSFSPEASNHKLLLDNGKVVFGCECWWDSEEKVASLMGNREIVYIDIDEWRSSGQELFLSNDKDHSLDEENNQTQLLLFNNL